MSSLSCIYCRKVWFQAICNDWQNCVCSSTASNYARNYTTIKHFMRTWPVGTTVPVKSKLKHPPPLGNPPPAFAFLFKSPPPKAKKLFKCPIIGPFHVIKCPTPGNFSVASIMLWKLCTVCKHGLIDNTLTCRRYYNWFLKNSIQSKPCASLCFSASLPRIGYLSLWMHQGWSPPWFTMYHAPWNQRDVTWNRS